VPNVHDAQDLTQAFFSHLLEKRTIARADRTRGRFRAFLLTALKHFLLNEREKARAEKRGGGRPTLSLDFDSGESRYQIEPADEVTPEALYERRWVLTLLDLVLVQLRAELTDARKETHFEALKPAEALSSIVSSGGAPHRGGRGRSGRRDTTDPGRPGWMMKRLCYRMLAIR
jgi:RNA polymerase sigma-70 factor (ECF subfamily)